MMRAACTSLLVALLVGPVEVGCGGAGSADPGGGDPTPDAGAGGGGQGGGGEGGAGAAGGQSGGGTGGSGDGGAGAAGGEAGASGAGAAGAGGEPPCAAGTIVCEGMTKKVCDGSGGFGEETACDTLCLAGLGCAVCTPGDGVCKGTIASHCKADGSGFEDEECGPMLGCNAGNCGSACAPAMMERSYIGCDYFPTVTSNQGLYQGFSFAVAVANTTNKDATVTASLGPNFVGTTVVKANSLATLKLPWVDALKHTLFTPMASGRVTGGAFHLKTTQPVTVYQFNPLEYEIPPAAFCLDPQFTGKCFSYTNDASLLLPVNALGSEYIAVSRGSIPLVAAETGAITALPGLVAITATADDTSVTVTSSAHTLAGSGVKAMNPGESQTFTLNAGDVVQLISGTPGSADELSGCVVGVDGSSTCQAGAAYDLTGTVIASSKPVSVIGGHDCSFVPYDKTACDHLEEINFPLATWGKQVIVTPPQAVTTAAQNDGTPDPHLVRIISGADGNQISVDPAPDGVTLGTLNKGQWVEIPASSADFLVKGTGPLLVAQYMVGGDLVGPKSSGTPNSKGDPSLSLAVPFEQYRSSYTFLAPESYAFNFINVIAPAGAAITLDGAPLGGPAPKPVGASGYTVVRKLIAGGAHVLGGDAPFGVVVYGYGTYTSYMYPGGLNLDEL